jgi:MFS family permease
VSAALRRSIGSLEIPNYRRWFAGQLVSISGNWMQIVAEMWLVLTLTGSALAVGLTSALQFLPILLAGAWGGLIADSVPKRRLLMVTQSLMALPALALFALAVTGEIQAWMVMGLVLVRGTVLAVDMPARQSFVVEIVGPDRVVSAVGLQSVLIHSSRIAGPALAGILIAVGGIEACFLLNALSFAAMLLALRSLDTKRLAPPRLAVREPGAVRSAFRYVRETPALAIPLAMMALVGTLGFNFQVLLPLLARDTFGGGATAYSALAVAMGVGAVAGALATGARRRIGDRLLVGASLAFAVFAGLAALAPTLWLEAAALVPLGFASVTFAAGVNSTLQLAADPQMRGRVMALYSIVFLGSTPIGGPIAGLLAGVFDARAALVMAALAALVAGIGAHVAFGRRADRAPSGAASKPEGLSRSEPAAAEAASPPAADRDRAQACEAAGPAPEPSSARRRSGPRRDPRPPARRPRDAATRAR